MSPTEITAEGARAEHVVVAMAQQHDVAGLSFDNGASLLNVRTMDGAGPLLRGRFTDPLPLVWAADANVHIEYPLGARLAHTSRPGELHLSARRPWSVDVHGGTDRFDADLSGLRLSSLTFHSGLAHAHLRLGGPRGRRMIRFSSVTDLVLTRPVNVPVRVEATKGVSRLGLDDRSVDAANGFEGQTHDYNDADDRYLILLTGDVASLTITTAPELG
ncbi:hypothetical protein [Actinomadura verrucosospora]|uniref:MarR family transcriptional regulator n=1 Tax=Actinomadura verrucosospora TaxID=46165 RepID=A0A7D3W1E7_ACTVE|nr:hypothetical protein [Actinomadura verrucosospora]QKG27219.1 MarR family transcriptional regulator [Actinomadura verrucosospora]